MSFHSVTKIALVLGHIEQPFMKNVQNFFQLIEILGKDGLRPNSFFYIFYKRLTFNCTCSIKRFHFADDAKAYDKIQTIVTVYVFNEYFLPFTSATLGAVCRG